MQVIGGGVIAGLALRFARSVHRLQGRANWMSAAGYGCKTIFRQQNAQQVATPMSTGPPTPSKGSSVEQTSRCHPTLGRL